MTRTSFTAVAFASAALSLSFAAPGAMAASQASASLDSITFTLIDLNPFDGVAPSMTFLTSGGGSTTLSVSASDTAVGESESASRTRAGTFSFSREFLAELNKATATASIDASRLAAQGRAFGPQTSFNATASTGGGYSLTLSANSALLITANISLNAEASNGTCSNGYYYYCYNNADSATASASLSLSYNYYASGVNVSYSRTDNQSLTASSYAGSEYYDWVYNPNTGWYEQVWHSTPATQESKSFSGGLSAIFTNMTQSSQNGALSLGVGAQGTATSAPALVTPTLASRSAMVSSVPEAETWMLSLAGLAAVSLVRPRRAR